MRKISHFHRYLVGLAAVFAGAWMTQITASMLPLALGASLALMCTAPLVKQIWTRQRRH